jgi:hypothetical protein
LDDERQGVLMVYSHFIIIIIIIIILRHPGPFRAFAFVQLKSWWRMGSIYLF